MGQSGVQLLDQNCKKLNTWSVLWFNNAMSQKPRALHNGRLVQLLRESKGWSGQYLARRAGVSRTTLHSLENAKSDAQAETLIKIAKALDVDDAIFRRETTDLHRLKEEVAGLSETMSAEARELYYVEQGRIEWQAEKVWIATPIISGSLAPVDQLKNQVEQQHGSTQAAERVLKVYSRRALEIQDRLAEQDMEVKVLCYEASTQSAVQKMSPEAFAKRFEHLSNLQDQAQDLLEMRIHPGPLTAEELRMLSFALIKNHSGWFIVIADNLYEDSLERGLQIIPAGTLIFARHLTLFHDLWSEATPLSPSDFSMGPRGAERH